jgi:hypothetical protein
MKLKFYRFSEEITAKHTRGPETYGGLHFAVEGLQKSRKPVRRGFWTILLLFATFHARAALRYVDSSVATSGNGQSWSSPWKNLTDVTGVSGGDTVYISGGSTTQTYNVSNWSPIGGTSGNPVHYKVGIEAGHNGVVMVNGGGNWNFFTPPSYVDIDGNAGGARHIVLTNANSANSATYIVLMNEGTSSQQTFRYMEFYGGITVNGCNGVEFDHCKWNAVNWANRQLFLQGDFGSSVMEGFVHDCEFHMLNTAGFPATGDDGIAGANITVSNCSFYGQSGSYLGNQHEDFIQTSAGLVHVVNCYFQNSGQYGVYGEFRYSGGDLQVLNCVFVNCAAQSIAIGGGPNISMSTIVVANNLCIGAGNSICCWNAGTTGDTFSNCYIYNNINANSGPNIIDSAVTTAHNLTSFTTSGFVNYAGGDYHLNSSATAAIGQGQNCSTWFAYDKDSNTRSTPWDIGPYKYGSAAAQLTANAGPDQQVTMPNSVTLNGSYSASAGGTVTLAWSKVSGPGSVSFSAPAAAVTTAQFSAAGTYVLRLTATQGTLSATDDVQITVSVAGDTTPPVVTLTSPLNGAVLSNTVTLTATATDNTGGSGLASVSVLIDGNVVASSATAPITLTWNTQNVINGLHSIVAQALDAAGNQGSSAVANVTIQNQASTIVTNIQASMAAISSPFTLSNGVLSQAVETGVANGGVARFNFTVPTTGSYVINMMVNAADTNANSIYVNVETMPIDPTMIWDIPVTSGFQNQMVSWRGNGTADADQFVPQSFALTAGQHTLIVVGRESGVGIQSVQVQSASALVFPPINLHILF